MSVPLLIRSMHPSERSMVLSNWKLDLKEQSPAWGRSLHIEEWWALVNHVIDKISFPSMRVLVACHESTPQTPLAWVAYRDGAILHLHATAAVHNEPELAAFLERELRSRTGNAPEEWNPFMELKRCS